MNNLFFYCFCLASLLCCSNTLFAQLPEGTYYSSQAGVKTVTIKKSNSPNHWIVNWAWDNGSTLDVRYEKVKDSLNHFLAYKEGEAISLLVLNDGYIVENDIIDDVVCNHFILATKKRIALGIDENKEFKSFEGKFYPEYPFYQNNLGKIVFSNAPIMRRSESNSTIISTYIMGQPLFCRVFLEKPIKDFAKDYFGGIPRGMSEITEFYLDGQKIAQFYENFISSYGINNRLSWPACVYNTTEKTSCFINFHHTFESALILKQDLLTIGMHKLEIKFFISIGNNPGINNPIATGSIDLLVTGENKDAIIKKGLIKAGIVDKELEAGIQKVIQQWGKSNNREEEFVGVVIESEDWQIERHQKTGVLMGRSLVAYCYAKWPDGHCSHQRFIFMQDHDGEGYQKQFHILYMGDRKNVPCSSIPKPE